MSVVINAQLYKYPTTPIRPVTDEYFGMKVTDNYRWLENQNDPEVQGWLKSQSDFTNTILVKLPNRQTIFNELKNNQTYTAPEFSHIAKTAGRYFYGKQLPNEQVRKLYYRTGLNGKEVLLFDPEKYVEGKIFEFSSRVSSDGRKLLISLYEAGTELGDLKVLDIQTGKFLPDTIKHSRPGSFVGESNTEIIYYEYKNYDLRVAENRQNVTAKLHVLGTPEEADIILASSEKYPDLLQPFDFPLVGMIKDCPYIFLSKVNTESYRTRYYAPKSDLKKSQINWKLLTDKEDQVKDYFVHGKDIYFLTSKGNPNFKLVKTDLDSPNLKSAKTIFEGSREWKLDYVALTKNFLVFTKSKYDLIVRSMAFELSTEQLSEINIPVKGNVYVDSLSEDYNEILLVTAGWTFPERVVSYNLKSKKKIKGIYDSTSDVPGLENLVFEEAEVTSHDGVLVPLSLVYDKTRLKKDGSNAAFMEGYGAYGRTPLVPALRSETLPLLKRGVVFAYAHVRGGGEKGIEWYLSGKKSTKPNTWKDLNACAEYLVKNKYTSTQKLGIISSSAGGIMIGRAITERPDLYKVAIARVGLLNTLRMEFSPNGPANIPEFGTVGLESEFKSLLEMDSIYHIKNGIRYPAQLILAGINDPRVAYYIPAKFAAAMQANSAEDGPVLLDLNYKAGHFGGITQDEQFEQTAKEYAFFLWQTGYSEFQD